MSDFTELDKAPEFMTQIDKGIPVPTQNYGKNRELLKQLEVGDSIYFSEDYQRILNGFYNVAKRLGIKIAIRRQPEAANKDRLSSLNKGLEQ